MQNVEILHKKTCASEEKPTKWVNNQIIVINSINFLFTTTSCVEAKNSSSLITAGYISPHLQMNKQLNLILISWVKSIHGLQVAQDTPDGFTQQIQATTPCWWQIGGNLKPYQPVCCANRKNFKQVFADHILFAAHTNHKNTCKSQTYKQINTLIHTDQCHRLVSS